MATSELHINSAMHEFYLGKYIEHNSSGQKEKAFAYQLMMLLTVPQKAEAVIDISDARHLAHLAGLRQSEATLIMASLQVSKLIQYVAADATVLIKAVVYE